MHPVHGKWEISILFSKLKTFAFVFEELFQFSESDFLGGFKFKNENIKGTVLLAASDNQT